MYTQLFEIITENEPIIQGVVNIAGMVVSIVGFYRIHQGMAGTGSRYTRMERVFGAITATQLVLAGAKINDRSF